MLNPADPTTLFFMILCFFPLGVCLGILWPGSKIFKIIAALVSILCLIQYHKDIIKEFPDYIDIGLLSLVIFTFAYMPLGYILGTFLKKNKLYLIALCCLISLFSKIVLNRFLST